MNFHYTRTRLGRFSHGFTMDSVGTYPADENTTNAVVIDATDMTDDAALTAAETAFEAAFGAIYG